MTRLKKSRGFTLIELIVVIVIIAILVAVAAVAYNSVIGNSKQSAANTTAAQIAKTLQGESAAQQKSWDAMGAGTASADAIAYLTADNDATTAGVQSVLTTEFGATPAVTATPVTPTAVADELVITRDTKTATIKLSSLVGGGNTVK
ncbi:prepilin-type N-terminal cleavage/methylation domain-containing protein [Janibacter anophelis]|uniref:prepilin-type N-terminal cleavage/methylation domain-containing protein n=1 Tax=Janibacter anophelis TaxID=319054 RepID=UPI000A003470|nr:prepilin-type N-terminal cleavage/methylation domain-containing protein [Janibacter anophelis]